MDKELMDKITNTKNSTILDGYCKAESVLNKAEHPVCSISGGSDSDIMLDIIYNLDKDKKVVYYWFDTGIEYKATKEHLKYLEDKYRIDIVREKAIKPIPKCIKEYGYPFLSKNVSEMMSRLQKHNFQWEDEPYEVLIQRYPNCKCALQWWCNIKNDDTTTLRTSQFSIAYNKWLKEFVVSTPPDSEFQTNAASGLKRKLHIA